MIRGGSSYATPEYPVVFTSEIRTFSMVVFALSMYRSCLFEASDKKILAKTHIVLLVASQSWIPEISHI